VDERRDDGQAAVHVGLLHGDPAEVLEARQPAVLDDEVELGERGRRLVDVVDVERIAVQWPDRRALVDVDVADAEVLGLLEVAQCPVVAELPAL
jgi:hypothetical protein